MLNLRYFRLRSGLSQEKLAEKVGVYQSQISMWECGLEVSPKNLEKVHRALKDEGVLPDFFSPSSLLEEVNGGEDESQNLQEE